MPNQVSPERAKRDVAVKALMALVAAGVVAGCASSTGAVSPGARSAAHAAHDGLNVSRALPANSPTPVPADTAACAPGPAPASATCGAVKAPGPPGKAPVGGLTPAQLRAAYGLPAAPASGVPAGPVITVVEAFDSPQAEQDLKTYRTQFGLPACTTPNGCFTKTQVPPTPGAPPPAPAPPGNSSDATTWADERALDLAVASAACPMCRIALVEAAGEDLDSLSAAVGLAATYHPAVMSISWGVPEYGNGANIDAVAQSQYDRPGVPMVASAGDLGNGLIQFPASSPYVTSVGGTSLTPASNARGWSESEWGGSGDGCSAMFAQPSWQTIATPCKGARAIPDVSFLANANPGVAVYVQADGGWVVLGGTSVGAPWIAALYAQAGDYGLTTVGAPNLYAHIGALNPVAGANGSPNGVIGF